MRKRGRKELIQLTRPSVCVRVEEEPVDRPLCWDEKYCNLIKAGGRRGHDLLQAARSGQKCDVITALVLVFRYF